MPRFFGYKKRFLWYNSGTNKKQVRIVNDLNIKKQAADLGVSVWQAPSFLFMLMGLITLIAMTATYYISKNYDSPEILVLAESIVVITIFTIGNSVIHGVEEIAKVNKMKTEFVSVASHQLRTPLSAIRWETELMLTKHRAGLDAKQQAGIEGIAQLSARMTRLVNDLLDVARIDQGRLTLKKEKIDLGKITGETLEIMRPLAEAKDIRIVFNRDEKAHPIIGDADKLKLAIENLVSNAIKYTLNRGKIEVNLAEEGNFAVFSIQDNGVGIPEPQQKMVFNKFFRSDNVVKYQTEGTGLGLYIAKNVIEQSGGKIWFKSQENSGTIFNFSVPINK